MVSRGKRVDVEAQPFVNIGVPRPLVDEMDRFIAEHPEFGIMQRNDFARRAIGEKLSAVRHEVHERMLMEAYKAGKPGPLDELRRLRP